MLKKQQVVLSTSTTAAPNEPGNGTKCIGFAPPTLQPIVYTFSGTHSPTPFARVEREPVCVHTCTLGSKTFYFFGRKRHVFLQTTQTSNSRLLMNRISPIMIAVFVFPVSPGHLHHFPKSRGIHFRGVCLTQRQGTDEQKLTRKREKNHDTEQKSTMLQLKKTKLSSTRSNRKKA